MTDPRPLRIAATVAAGAAAGSVLGIASAIVVERGPWTVLAGALAGALGAAVGLGITGRERWRIDVSGVPGAQRRWLTRTPRHSGIVAASSTPTVSSAPEHAEVSRLRETSRSGADDPLLRFLGLVRDLVGADEVVLWRWAAGTGELVPAAASTRGERDVLRSDATLALIRWTAEQGVVQCDDGGSAPTIASAPVATSTGALGALSIESATGLGVRRDAIRSLLPAIAEQIGALVDLSESSRALAEQSRRAHAILETAQEIQSATSLNELGEVLCRVAVEATGADRAVLVRWNATSRGGEIQSATAGHPLSPGWLVRADSRVAAICESGLPQLWSDARSTTAEASVFGAAEARRTLGSLAIIPLQRGRRVLGALVLEGDAPDSLALDDTRSAALIGSMASGALEAFWQAEEASRRARTDQLTGLANRRTFDEQLRRMAAETDRFGGALSLVIVDVDHFKRVNDEHGHEAGDVVLRRVARLLRDGVREVDVCARYGGEEIAILLPQTGLDGARELAERLRRSLETQRIQIPGAELGVTASFGVASYPECVPLADGLFAAADRALYRAKQGGRNRVMSHAVRGATT